MASLADQGDISFTVSRISLPHKPSAEIAYTFIPAKTSTQQIIPTPNQTSQPLIVFVNGLGLPAASWYPTIKLLSSLPAHPSFLTYDRYGQGASTDRDPLDKDAEDPKHGHTIVDVVEDLQHLIDAICKAQDLYRDGNAPPIIFVANSIGCAIARVYADKFPNTVSGLLLLDSVIANTDFVSIFPDPEDLKGGSADLPEGVTLEDLVKTRQTVRMIFHPSQGSAEGLSRKNLKTLLPSSEGPRLIYNDGALGVAGEDLEKGPWVTVVGHGLDKFAEDSLKGMKIPIALNNIYTDPYWHAYNLGLTKITSQNRARGPILAEKAGHFVQKDDPELVFDEIKGMLGRMNIAGF